MTAIAAVLALAAAPSLAQDTVPPDPVVDTANTPATPDPLAPEAADTSVETSTAAPPPPKPKVETSRTKAASAPPTRRAAAAPARSSTRRAGSAAPAATPAAVAAVAPAAPVADAAPPTPPTPPAAIAEPAPVAEPTPATESSANVMTGLMGNELLLAGAGALLALALIGAAIAGHRRKRRREDAEFAAREQFLAEAEAEREATPEELQLEPADEVRSGPGFVRTAPRHDPVPPRLTPAGQPQFLFRRASEPAREGAELGKVD